MLVCCVAFITQSGDIYHHNILSLECTGTKINQAPTCTAEDWTANHFQPHTVKVSYAVSGSNLQSSTGG